MFDSLNIIFLLIGLTLGSLMGFDQSISDIDSTCFMGTY